MSPIFFYTIAGAVASLQRPPRNCCRPAPVLVPEACRGEEEPPSRLAREGGGGRVPCASTNGLPFRYILVPWTARPRPSTNQIPPVVTYACPDADLIAARSPVGARLSSPTGLRLAVVETRRPNTPTPPLSLSSVSLL